MDLNFTNVTIAAASARASMISSYAFLSNSVETRNTSYSCPKVFIKDTASRRGDPVNFHFHTVFTNPRPHHRGGERVK